MEVLTNNMDKFEPLNAMLRQKAQILDAEVQRVQKQKELDAMRQQNMLDVQPPAVIEQYQQPQDGQYTFLPNEAPITQKYGNYNPEVEKYSNGINYGTDFGVRSGTPIGLPRGNWKVVEAYKGSDFNRGYGQSVLVVNEDTGERLRMSHLSQVNVIPGQRIAGGVVGLSGSTGNSTGPHLDLEYYDNKGKLSDVTTSPYASYLFGR